MKYIILTLLYIFFLPINLIVGQYQNTTNKTRSSVISDSNITLLGNWAFTSAKDIYIDYDYAYLLRDNSIDIIDIKDPANSVSVGQLILTTSIENYRILASGNYAYVMCRGVGYYGLKIIDVSNPNLPTEIGFYTLSNSAGDMFDTFIKIKDDFVYVLNEIVEKNIVTLRVFDLRNPDNPQIIGEISNLSGSWITNFLILGNFGYVLTENGGFKELYKIDISNPQNLQVVNTSKTGVSNLLISDKYFYSVDNNHLKIYNNNDSLDQNVVGYYNFNDNEPINGICENGNYLYVAITEYDTVTYFYSHPCLHILDISNPAVPFEVNSYNKLFGGWWCSGGYWSSMKVHNDYIITPISCGLNFIDISDPSNPVELSSYFIGGYKFKDMDVEGNYAYVTNFQNSYLNVIDISDPANLKLTGYCYLDGENPNIFIEGKYAYIINYFDGNYLYIIDISNPTKPTKVSQLKLEYSVSDIFVQNKYVYLLADVLKIIDVNNPSKPTEVGFRNDPWGPINDFYVQGNYAYIASASGDFLEEPSTRFYINDISDPTDWWWWSPTVTGLYIGVQGRYEHIFVSGNYAYLIGRSSDFKKSWLDIFDISSPSNLKKINDQQISLSNPYIQDVFESNNYAYIAAGGSVEILDITDPNNVKEYANFGLNTSIESISVQNDNIYLLSEFSGLYVLQSGFATDINNEELFTHSFYLKQNYPNPFNPTTTIKYSIAPVVDANFASTTNVQLKIYDILGREIAVLVNEEQKPGYYEVNWDASDRPSGIYFYRITAGDPSASSGQVYVETKKMILMK